jgi:heterodisulfide reductase subunit B
MKYALFLGCTIPARGRNYELSARKVAEKLGIELIDFDGFMCCGFPIKSSDLDAAMVFSAYNLSLAQNSNLDVCTLCSSCTSALTEGAHHLSENEAETQRVNTILEKLDLQYGGKTRVRHFARILFEEVGLDKIKENLERELNDLKIAIHYGCHYLKPSNVFDNFDKVEDPQTIHSLVSLTGATVVNYLQKERCCGGPILPVDEHTALSVAKEKLDNIVSAGANAICLVCPFCSVMYDSNQKGIESEFGTTYNLPVLYLPQILGLAMGFSRKELGLNLNVVKTKALTESILN